VNGLGGPGRRHDDSAATARVLAWDGAPTNACDHRGCPNRPVIHAELSAPGTEYGAEADLCEEHLGALTEQGRAFLVALGLIEPSTELERNIVAAMGEHL